MFIYDWYFITSKNRSWKYYFVLNVRNYSEIAIKIIIMKLLLKWRSEISWVDKENRHNRIQSVSVSVRTNKI